jgi:hypothetical protein
MFAPCLLARTDPAIRGLSKTARPVPDAGARAPGPRRLVWPTPAPRLLDQWSRPSVRKPGARPESPIPMPSRSVRHAGKRHRHGGYVAGADAPDRLVTCQGCAGHRQRASGWQCRLQAASGAASPLGTSACTRFRSRLGAPQGGQQRLACPASWGEGVHSRAGCPRTTGLPTPGTASPGERDEDATESPTSRTRTPTDRPALPGVRSGTAAHVADHLVPGDTVPHAPGRELIVIDLFGQLLKRILH